ncbi:MAG: RsmD family RNA methyltransferase [Lentisphaeria bacterium]|nr:RsmD family RNA methyltransferase [Lentisphaeria bacterium]
MQIIAGKARGVELETAPTLDVRPTLARARKALFDSMGDWNGGVILDLCAGSGALGLEAASRGSAEILMVENNPRHVEIIKRNIAKLQKCSVDAEMKVLQASILDTRRIFSETGEVDLIFADPPYEKSAEFFEALLADDVFLENAAHAIIIWEIPDTPGSTGKFMKREYFDEFNIRKFGPTMFLIARFLSEEVE